MRRRFEQSPPAPATDRAPEQPTNWGSGADGSARCRREASRPRVETANIAKAEGKTPEREGRPPAAAARPKRDSNKRRHATAPRKEVAIEHGRRAKGRHANRSR